MDEAEIVAANIAESINEKNTRGLVFAITFQINKANRYTENFHSSNEEKEDKIIYPPRFNIVEDKKFQFVNGRGGFVNLKFSYFRKNDPAGNYFEIVYYTNNAEKPQETKLYLINSKNTDGEVQYVKVNVSK